MRVRLGLALDVWPHNMSVLGRHIFPVIVVVNVIIIMKSFVSVILRG